MRLRLGMFIFISKQMSNIRALLNEYGENHQNPVNKAFHWICVPLIMFSLIGILMSAPFFVSKTQWLNWGSVVLIGALVYYLRLSISMFIGFALIAFLLLTGNWTLFTKLNFDSGQLVLWSLGIFVAAWIGQFIGHKIEGKKPSFFKDVQFLLIGPAWLLHFIYSSVGIKFE